MKRISIFLVGPTASGKSKLALALARKIKGEIISCDAMQIYQKMDIGTAKPTREERDKVPHHLIDCASITQPWSVGQFVTAADEAIKQIRNKQKVPMLVGGTGLYFRSLAFGLSAIPEVSAEVKNTVQQRCEKEGLASLYFELAKIDPQWAGDLSPHDTQRILRAFEVYVQTGKSLREFWRNDPRQRRYEHLSFCLTQDRKMLYDRINDRVWLMLEQGLKQEALDLWTQYPQNEILRTTIGYAEWAKYGGDGDGAVRDKIQQNTRRFAKRQLTWFAKQPSIIWYDQDRISSLSFPT